MQHTIRHPPRATGERPFLVIWEVTRACDLVCRHCRASAVPEHDPRALTHGEGKHLLDQVAEFGSPLPLLVFTGGDPFKRPDLYELIEHARGLGLHPGISPSGTPLLTPERLERCKEAGAKTISLSIDGSNPEVHDAFRGVPGSFALTHKACQEARRLGFKLQINSTISRHNLHDLVALAEMVSQLDVMTWSVFFLVPMGRGQALLGLTPVEFEAVLNFLAEVRPYIPLKTTEAHHFKRVLLMRQVMETLGKPGPWAPLDPLYDNLRGQWSEVVERRQLLPRAAGRRAPMHINSGQGFVFINHLGDVNPSGFLPMSAGNVRDTHLLEIYQTSPLFQMLRDPDQLHGRCGRCEFRRECGGSRSRAFAVHGHPLAEEPACSYEPGSFTEQTLLAQLMNSRPPVPAEVLAGVGPLLRESLRE